MERFVVARERPGVLALAAAPRAAALADEVASLAAAGVTDVVCLLPDGELRRLGLEQEPDLLSRNGLRVHRLPVPDFSVPAPEPALALADAVAGRLAGGASVVVHCRGGIGRSSTVAALVLLREGVAPDDAWRALATARGRDVPDTAAQKRFVAGLAGQDVAVPPARRLAEGAVAWLGRTLGALARPPR